MTREEAKSYLIAISHILGSMATEYLTEKDGEKMREAITSLEQEPCEDCVSREAVKDILHKSKQKAIITFEDFEELVNKLPSVTPQQKIGRWIALENDEMETVGYYCSECDLPMETEYRTKFCPNCGQRKTEVSENE